MDAKKLTASQVEQDAFELIYLMSALSSLETVMSRNAGVDHIVDDAQDQLPNRLRMRLIAVAGNLRNFVFENWPTDAVEADRAQAQDRDVGLLFTKEVESPLNLRQACNKLVHARSIDYTGALPEIGRGKGRAMETLSVLDCILVTGEERNARPWTAMINVPEFAAGAYVSAWIVAGAPE